MLCRWAWNQVEKDNENLIKYSERPVVVKVLSEYNEHCKSCEIVGLIRDCTSKQSGQLEDDGLHRLLAVS